MPGRVTLMRPLSSDTTYGSTLYQSSLTFLSFVGILRTLVAPSPLPSSFPRSGTEIFILGTDN